MGRGMPRWSVSGQAVLSPASTAGLFAGRACVQVGPPLSCKGPSSGSVPGREPLVGSKPQEVSEDRLCPPSVMVPAQSPPSGLLATMVLASVVLPQLPLIPPPVTALLENIVVLIMVAVPSWLLIPPPEVALLPEKVLLRTARVAR